MLEQKYQKPPSPQNTTNSGSESDTSSVMELNEKLLEAHKKVCQYSTTPSKNSADNNDDVVDDDDNSGCAAEDEPGSCSHD